MDPRAKRPSSLVRARPHRAASAGAIAITLALNACGDRADPATDGKQEGDRSQLTGEELFRLPFPEANGRACATCHVPEDNFTLMPARVARLLQENPEDPLFNAIDADDPTAETLSFEHLQKGLVRVWLDLPDNVDLIDDTGNVVTPSDRKLFVWRGVPSIADSALTAPFQLDGRAATLAAQAQGAVTGHSQGGTAPASELERIAAFERTIFSSDRARSVADYLATGGDPANAPNVEDELELTPAEQRGREVYTAVCAKCHGGFNQATIVDRELHALAFPRLKPDGNVLYRVPATDPPTPVLAAQTDNEFVNIGSAYETFLGQLDPDSHVYTRDLSFPRYRYRFYTDASRNEIAADLPPSGPPQQDGFDLELDRDGNPVTGPNFGPQLFSADPGRSMITGSPYDFEAFDIPTLRGVAKTAPYFHNNSADTLERVIEVYSDHLLSRFPSLTLPGEKEPDDDGDAGAPEALTRDQKADLLAFLQRL
jgi:cytochrome c peroxidase